MRKQAKSVGPLLNKQPSKELPANELVQLSLLHADAVLAAEKHAHAQTKVSLIEALARARMAEAQAHVQQCFADKSAAEQRHRKLTLELRETHNLTDKHAIDPLTGVVVLPE